jgi:hypothetical protein
MISVFFALAYISDNENRVAREHAHEHDDEHHRNILVYYCLAIVPVLALSILLPNTCYSMFRRRRADLEEKLD